jgi:hypothetical protein
LGKHSCSKNGRESCAGREQINCYLWGGKLAITPAGMEGRGDTKTIGFTLSGNTTAIKGTEPCCSIPSTASWPLLAPQDGNATWLPGTPLEVGTRSAVWHRLHGFPAGHSRELQQQFTTMPRHGYSVSHSR